MSISTNSAFVALACLSGMLASAHDIATTTNLGRDSCDSACIPKHIKRKEGEALCCAGGHTSLKCPGPAYFQCGPEPRHVWFRFVTAPQRLTNNPYKQNTCGEIDAASRMPASLFEPQNAPALQNYINFTLELFTGNMAGLGNGEFAVGRCSDLDAGQKASKRNQIKPFGPYLAKSPFNNGTRQVEWAGYNSSFFSGFCQKQCGCKFCQDGCPFKDGCGCCTDEPDDPKKGKFCSLCGPKYNSGKTETFATVDLYQQETIVQVAQSVPSLTTLVEAVVAAQLATFLSTAQGKAKPCPDGRTGPHKTGETCYVTGYTVFAPSDEAFAKLPATVLTTLLQPENINLLQQVLTVHVVPFVDDNGGTQQASDYNGLMASDLKNGMKLMTTAGVNLTVSKTFGGTVYISSPGTKASQVTLADTTALNGVVHMVDTVLLPPGYPACVSLENCLQKNIAQLATETPELNTLATALQAADLVATLATPVSRPTQGFTVFAPTNAAFSALPKGVLANLLKPVNKAQLADVLTYHVVKGYVKAADLTDGQQITTVEGKKLTVRIIGGSILINSAKVVSADVEASNGVVHILDGVLLPNPN